jgi:hypothetical protein
MVRIGAETLLFHLRPPETAARSIQLQPSNATARVSAGGAPEIDTKYDRAQLGFWLMFRYR